MKATQDGQKRQIPQPRTGLPHVLDAAAYSWAGCQRLFQETAARLELLGLLIAAVCFVATSAAWWQWAALIALFALVLAAEAVNTAIEVLVDHVSPEWSEAAKHAKDLGSFAVGLMLLLTFGFVLGVTLQTV
ncbi:MAG: diacylglycerol kinase [Paracoccaceae bacterium]|uniref:diacylglycerol kinase n=1 Tax=Seohaeicola saemankumensis TaxID=481181 RepID=UPI001E34BB06|nr:diacylglycerol kinase [Seohaeicola saemankumensis]MCD1624381.1 diacylglycerol kinase [Seohaeicola saemankumensis]